MQSEAILTNIAKHISLNSEEADHFISLLQFKKIKRKEWLLQEDQPCRYIYYVNAGAVRAYHLDKKGKESTIMFAIADWWITDMPCFIRKEPAMVYIQAIEETEVWQLSRENFDLLLEVLPKFERFFRVLMQNAYIREQLRVLQNLSQTAEERYENFLGKYPQIAEQVTQKQIASYLGVTPEFLSVIRKKRISG